MAAPVATFKIKLESNASRFKTGHSSRLHMDALPAVELWDITVKPAGVKARHVVDQTTMHNLEFGTKYTGRLVDASDVTIEAAYSAGGLRDILNAVAIHQTFTVNFPDGSLFAFFGAITNAEPNELSEGDRPTVTLTIEVENLDNENWAEQKPVFSI